MDKLINRERMNVISSERRMNERNKGDDTDSNQSRMNKLKASVQRKLTGVINGINQKDLLLHGTTVILYCGNKRDKRYDSTGLLTDN